MVGRSAKYLLQRIYQLEWHPQREGCRKYRYRPQKLPLRGYPHRGLQGFRFPVFVAVQTVLDSVRLQSLLPRLKLTPARRVHWQ